MATLQLFRYRLRFLLKKALSYGGGKAAWITDKLGIDEFEFNRGKTAGYTGFCGQYLTPDFYVGAKWACLINRLQWY